MSLTPPVTRDEFEYYNHEFYAISNDKPYRRSSIAELKAFFFSSSSTSLLTVTELSSFTMAFSHQIARARDVETCRCIESRQRRGLCESICTGEMRFLGNGEIEETFNVPDTYTDYIGCNFWGNRTSDKNETQAPRDAWSMRDEWHTICE
ncbi:hypothetical protein GB937_008679 [Aspergillus fischeri]|nr:hypothetical protein GB937_008679 [Aspergillus fischeri]